MTNAQPSFGAIGPSHVDPRSGEILDADIGFESLSSRSHARAALADPRVERRVDWPALMQSLTRMPADGLAAAHGARPRVLHAAPTMRPSSWATRSTCSRRAATSIPASPEAQQFVLDYLTDD